MNNVKIFIYALALFLVILNISFFLSIFDLSWYLNQGLENKDITQTSNLFSYFKNKTGLMTEFYSDRELLHLKDIKIILDRFKLVSWSALILFLPLIQNFNLKKILKIIFLGGILALGFNLFIFGLVIFSFNYWFLLLHPVLFPNGNWQLDPSFELLIVLFPPDLFDQLFFKIFTTSLIINFLVTVLTGCLLFFPERLKKFKINN